MTTADGIWSMGDASTPYPLKHVANAEARTLVHNLAHPDDLRPYPHDWVPAAVFTDPQIATVGASEQDLSGRRYVSAVHEYADDFALISHPDHKIALAMPEMFDEIRGLPTGRRGMTSGEFPIVLSAGERRAFTANDIIRDPAWRKRDVDGARRQQQHGARAKRRAGHAAQRIGPGGAPVDLLPPRGDLGEVRHQGHDRHDRHRLARTEGEHQDGQQDDGGAGADGAAHRAGNEADDEDQRVGQHGLSSRCWV